MTIEAAVLRALATAHVSDEDEAAIQDQARDCLRGRHSPVVVGWDRKQEIFECSLCRTRLYKATR